MTLLYKLLFNLSQIHKYESISSKFNVKTFVDDILNNFFWGGWGLGGVRFGYFFHTNLIHSAIC